MPPTVDVVIPAHNNFELTEACLRCLAVQTIPHRVVVYDDGSTDGTSQRLAEAWPEVTVVLGGCSRGFAAAANGGVAAGDGEVIVLINNDVECREDFLERIVAPLEDPGVGSVAALMLRPGEQLIDSVGLACDVTLAAYPRLQGMPRDQASAVSSVVVGPSGTAAAYRRTAWRQVGGLDETITAYMEDFDLALRLRSAGWETAVAHDAVGVHLGSATYGHRTSRQRLCGGFSRGYLLRRYGVLRSRVLFRALATELVVVISDVVISKDMAALRGRLAGLRAASGRPTRPYPPPQAIEAGIGFWRSLQMRRGIYEPRRRP